MATAPASPAEAPTLLPVAEAAQALGVSVSAVRRGLKSGRYRGQRQETPQGFVWLVEVGAGTDDRVGGDRLRDDRIGELRVGDDRIRELRVGGDRVGGERQASDPPDGPPEASPSPQEPPQEPSHRPPGPQAALLAQRAEEMARYSAALLAPLHAELKAQAEELGALRERVATLQAQLADRDAPAGAPEAPEAPGEPWPPARRWWQRLLWG
jgi:hypothetical protein